MVTLNISLSDGTVEIESDPEQLDAVTGSAIKLIEALAAVKAHILSKPQGSSAADQVNVPEEAQPDSPNGTIKPKARSKKGGAKTKNWQHLPDLLDHDGWKAVGEFYEQKQPSGQNEQVAVLVDILSSKLARKGIEGNEIHSAFKTLGLKTPANLTGVLGNMASVGLGHTTDGKFFLDFKGKQMVDHDLPRQNAAKK